MRLLRPGCCGVREAVLPARHHRSCFDDEYDDTRESKLTRKSVWADFEFEISAKRISSHTCFRTHDPGRQHTDSLPNSSIGVGVPNMTQAPAFVSRKHQPTCPPGAALRFDVNLQAPHILPSVNLQGLHTISKTPSLTCPVLNCKP